MNRTLTALLVGAALASMRCDHEAAPVLIPDACVKCGNPACDRIGAGWGSCCLCSWEPDPALCIRCAEFLAEFEPLEAQTCEPE